MRSLFLVIMVGLFGLTHGAVGAAQGAGAPVGSVVICRGHGAVVIHVDAQGNEVVGWQLCPDHVGTLLAAVTAAPALVPVPAPARRIDAPRAVAQQPPAPVGLNWGRGPPTRA